MGHIWKNGPHPEKWGSHLEKRVTLRKIVHTWKNGCHFEKKSYLRKWVPLETMGNINLKNIGHTWKKRSPLEESQRKLHF